MIAFSCVSETEATAREVSLRLQGRVGQSKGLSLLIQGVTAFIEDWGHVQAMPAHSNCLAAESEELACCHRIP